MSEFKFSASNKEIVDVSKTALRPALSPGMVAKSRLPLELTVI